jgi:2-iminoacetate synthase
MALCKSGQIQNCCHPNALMTLKEYLCDYASAKTLQAGDSLIQREIENVASDKVKGIVRTRLGLIQRGERDFRF